MISILINKLEEFVSIIKEIQKNDAFHGGIPNLKNKTLRYFNIDEVYLSSIEFFATAEFYKLDKFLNDNKDENSKFTFRLKTFESFEKKWIKNSRVGCEKKFYKACNDNYGYRFIVDCKEEDLINLVNSLEIKDVTIIDFYSKNKTNDDGYRGIYMYFWYNRRGFPLEFQIWTVKDALLQFYTHEIIYKGNSSIPKKQYAKELRKWLNLIPNSPDEIELDYIRYLYGVLNKDK